MSPSRRRALQLGILSSFSTVGYLGRLRDGVPADTDPNTPTTVESETATTSESETMTETDSAKSPETALELGETFESSDGTSLTVNSVSIHRLVRSTSVGSSSHIDVAWLDGHQFAVTDLDVSGPADDLGSEVPLALDVDGTQYPRPDQHWYRTYPPGTSLGGDSERPAYPAPITDAQSASIVWLRENPVRWQLPADTVAQLGRAPSFEVTSMTVPSSVTSGSSFEASITVRNSGAEGRFLTEFGAGPISDHGEVSFTVPADGKRTYTATMHPYYTEGVSSVDVEVDWGKERLTRTVTVE